jgi:hypothetical protein
VLFYTHDVHLLKAMSHYQVPEISTITSALSRPAQRNRRTVVMEMTQVALQELYFGHVKSAIDSFRIIANLLLGGRQTRRLSGWM